MFSFLTYFHHANMKTQYMFERGEEKVAQVSKPANSLTKIRLNFVLMQSIVPNLCACVLVRQMWNILGTRQSYLVLIHQLTSTQLIKTKNSCWTEHNKHLLNRRKHASKKLMMLVLLFQKELACVESVQTYLSQ